MCQHEQAAQHACRTEPDRSLNGILAVAAQPLPRLLWELGGSAPATSLVALRMLHDAGRFARPGGPIAKALQALQPQLAPLYASVLPAKPSKKALPKKMLPKQANGHAPAKQAPGMGGARPAEGDGGQKGPMRLLPGPLAQLPAECQVLPTCLTTRDGDRRCVFPSQASPYMNNVQKHGTLISHDAIHACNDMRTACSGAGGGHGVLLPCRVGGHAARAVPAVPVGRLPRLAGHQGDRRAVPCSLRFPGAARLWGCRWSLLPA